MLLRRQRSAVADRPGLPVALHHLLGDGQAHPLCAGPRAPAGARRPRAAAARAPPARRRRCVARRSDLRPSDLGRRQLPLGVQVECPQHGGAPRARQQAGCALGEHRRVQRRLDVGAVHGQRPLVRVAVQRPVRGDEDARVGDRVADAMAVAAPLDVQRLVEVARPGRIDGDEPHVEALRVGHPLRGRRGLGPYVRGKARRHAGFAPDRGEAVAHRGRGRHADGARGQHGIAPHRRQSCIGRSYGPAAGRVP